MNKKLPIILALFILVGVIAFRATTHTSTTAILKETANLENLHHLTLKIEGMNCASCPYNVENALKDSAGVVNATVGFAGKEIINSTVEGRGEVIYDFSKKNPDNLIQVILPYKGTMLSDEKANSTELAPLSKTFSF